MFQIDIKIKKLKNKSKIYLIHLPLADPKSLEFVMNTNDDDDRDVRETCQNFGVLTVSERT